MMSSSSKQTQPSGHVYLATSLDGFVARGDCGLDWLPQEPQEGEDLGYEQFMESVDGLIMGRVSYETVLSFGQWPYKKPVVVLSKSLTQADVPHDLQTSVQIVNLSPVEVMEYVGAQGWSRAYIDGGELVNSFIREGLIEDLILTVIPVMIGEGKSLYGPLSKDVHLKLIRSQSYPSGMIQNHYKIL